MVLMEEKMSNQFPGFSGINSRKKTTNSWGILQEFSRPFSLKTIVKKGWISREFSTVQILLESNNKLVLH